MKNQIKYYLKKLKLNYQKNIQSYEMSKFQIKNEEFAEIIKKNREYLKTIETFLTSDQFEKIDYGIPKNLFKYIDYDINNYPTYTDLIIFMSKFLKKQNINYLEIGVSVMKNYLQIANQFNNSLIVGFDNNDLNPNFEHLFQQENSFLSKSKIKSNDLIYFKGDLLSKKDTKLFKELNTKYDIIFSDALHTKVGVQAEYENIIKNSLSDEFILYFDDLDFPDLFEASKDIYDDLKNEYKELFFYSFDINGWMGEHEKFHTNGFISSLNFKKIFENEKIKLKNFKSI